MCCSSLLKIPKGQVQLQAKPVTAKDISSALNDVEIATIRSMSQEDIFSCDLLGKSPLFEGHITTKHENAKLVTELDKRLTDEDKQFTRHLLT